MCLSASHTIAPGLLPPFLRACILLVNDNKGDHLLKVSVVNEIQKLKEKFVYDIGAPRGL